MPQVTDVLEAVAAGDPLAASQLLPLVYDELRKLAAVRLAQEKPGHTLEPTALVHEAYLRLVGPLDQAFNGRGHFFAAAAEAMRRILVDSARRKGCVRHGGGKRRVELQEMPALSVSEDILAIDEALTRLADHAPVRAELVKLRYFAGMTMSEAATTLGISLATAERYWAFARTWLYAELNDEEQK